MRGARSWAVPRFGVATASNPRWYGKVVEKPMSWIGNYYGAERLRLR